jgi:hypothetical protein
MQLYVSHLLSSAPLPVVALMHTSTGQVVLLARVSCGQQYYSTVACTDYIVVVASYQVNVSPVLSELYG